MQVDGYGRTAAWGAVRLGNTDPVTAGTQHSDADRLAAAGLDRLRAAVAVALEEFLDGQRRTLGDIDASLVPIADEIAALARGGKRLRPAFAYWGWRGAALDSLAPLEDDAAVLRAVAALEFFHVSALVHDDVMDGAHTRRGRPATHIGFAARHDGTGYGAWLDVPRDRSSARPHPPATVPAKRVHSESDPTWWGHRAGRRVRTDSRMGRGQVGQY